MVRLTTERLILREFTEADWPALQAIESRPDVARYQSFEPRTAKESRDYVLTAVADADAEPRMTYDLAITLRDGGLLIGRCGLGLSDETSGEALLWYTLHPEQWGHGYGTEAARAIVDFAFRELGMHRVCADCDPANVGSWRVLEKIGMRREGHLRESVWIKGAWADSFIYAVLDREWLPRPAIDGD
ncbi:MAG: GNAT family protein [Thermomicrobiales bacterium]